MEFVDPNIYIVSIDSVLLEQVTFHLAIPMLTELGAKELIVTNGDGRQTSAPGILTVVEAGSIVPDGGPGSGDSPKEVRLCPCRDCPLWGFRFGKRPATVAKQRGVEWVEGPASDTD